LASSDASSREHTRLLMIYNLVPQMQPAQFPVHPLTEVLDLGRFSGHIQASGRLLPQTLFHKEVASISLNPDLPPVSGDVRKAGLIVAVTPRGDLLLLVDV
jgi:hypothetical protein